MHNKRKALIGKLFKTVLSCFIVLCTCFTLLPSSAVQSKTLYQEEPVQTTNEDQTQNEQSVVEEEPSTNTEDSSTQNEPSTNNEEQTTQPSEQSEDETEDESQSDETVSSDGFDLSDSKNKDKLHSVTLQYNTDPNATTKTWVDITGDDSQKIPGDAEIKLAVSFKNITTEMLKNNFNCTLTYDLPDFLRHVAGEAKGVLYDGGTAVGTVSVDENTKKIRVTFNESYLQRLLDTQHTTITGNFSVSGQVNLTKLPGNGKTNLTLADKDYTLNFGEDPISKYGKVDIKKDHGTKVVSTKDGDFLQYTVTVTAGEDGCPDVSVVDAFTSDSDQVTYMNVTNTAQKLNSRANGQNPYQTGGTDTGFIYLGNKTSDTEVPKEGSTINNSLVWKIGDMAARETRTLTYFVKLKNGISSETKSMNNNAVVFSKENKRSYATSTFTPSVNYSNGMNKTSTEIKKNSDGSYTIKYQLNFSLNKDNSNYSLKDFKFYDFLNYNDQYHFRVDSRALPYVNYDKSSFNLSIKRDGDKDFTEVDSSEYQIDWKGSDLTGFELSGKNDGFMVNPGDSYKVTYSLTVQPEAFAAIQSDQIYIGNRFLVSASNGSKQCDKTYIDKVGATNTIGDYHWNNKSRGEKITSDQRLKMSDDRYVVKDGTVKKDTSSDSSFDVPEGSYLYVVNVNQSLGAFDATELTMQDKLSPENMQYVGYARIDATSYNAETNKYEIKDTKWLKIDGLTTFKLKPSELGWKDKNYAYQLTYYAKPVNQDTYGTTTVNNTFTINGNVTNGNNTFPINNLNSSTSVNITGNYKLDVSKAYWYYQEPKENATSWQKGKLYWVIDVSGTAIKENTSFKDAISNDVNLTDSFIHDDSLVGVYQGNLPKDKTVSSYQDFDELQSSVKLNEITDKFEKSFSNSKNFSGNNQYSELTLKAKETIKLGDAGHVYIVLCTEPQSLPKNYRDQYQFKNEIYTRNDDDANYIKRGDAREYLCGGGDILKELGQTFTYDGKTVTTTVSGTGENASTIYQDGLKDTGAGQYAAWAFKLNYAGDLSGTYRVLENIPDGMELAYIRVKWVGDNQGTIESKTIDGLENDGWSKKTITASLDKGVSRTTTYYVKGKKAYIALGDFKKSGADEEPDKYAVDVQVVCKVVDRDALLSGQDKTFENKVTLQDNEGNEINNATSQATIKDKNLLKSVSKKNTEKVTFTIKSNPLGQQLSKDGAKLKLIDKLSDTLILDSKSIKAVDSNNNDVTNEITPSLNKDKNILEILVPSDKAITITYTTTVKAGPGQKVDFSNVAYWEGYKPSDQSSVTEEGYSYNASGSVSPGDSILLKILKQDANGLKSLSGAEFKVVACERLDDGTFKEITSRTWSGTTEDDGTLLLGGRGDSALSYNTVYKVTETIAPTGYEKVNNSSYIMVPRIEKDQTDYSDYVKECIKDSKIEKQYSSTYELIVTNHKGEITVQKEFIDAGNKKVSPVKGTYTFGLFENQNDSKPIQTASITYGEDQTVSTCKFTNLDVDTKNPKTYYVYELDDDGKPIKDSNVHTINGKEFYTSYGKNEVSNGNTVIITNQNRTKQLPSTGSSGTLCYRLAGITLMLLGSLLMLKKYKVCKNDRK